MTNECGNDQFKGRTYLYIRRYPDDYGIDALQAGTPGWASPDISIIAPDGTRNSEAISGKENHIEVIVTNSGGINATDALVEVFFGGPTTGFVPNNAQKIGSQFITVQGYSTQSVRIPWVPSASQAGHLCLTARVSLNMPPDSFPDPNSFDVYGDRHIAQRNIHVIELAGKTDFTFEFNLVKPKLNHGAEIVFQAQFVNGSKIESTLNKVMGCNHLHFSDDVFGKINLELKGRIFEAKPDGVWISIPECSPLKATLHIKGFKDIDNSCGHLHLLEVKLIDPSSNMLLGGLWLIINPKHKHFS